METNSIHVRQVSDYDECCTAGAKITGAVNSPVLYERRDSDTLNDRRALDTWFSRHFQGLSDLQKSELKNKYLPALTIDASERIIYSRVFDISEHYLSNWQGSGYKAQVVVQSNAAALKYQHYFEEIGLVHSEIMISSTATGDAEVQVDTNSHDTAPSCWMDKMKVCPTEVDYNEYVLNRFSHGVLPEILIVVDDLRRALNVPRNRVTYLACNVNPGALTAAIYQMNMYNCIDKSRPGKHRMLIDYADNELPAFQPVPLHRQYTHLTAHSRVSGFHNVMHEVSTLSWHHKQLYSVFELAGTWIDKEMCKTILADGFARKEFYSRFEKFASTLKLAMSVKDFVMQTSEKQLAQYRKHLSWFNELYAELKMQYAAANVRSGSQVCEERGSYYALPASKADAVVHVLLSLISEMYADDNVNATQYINKANQLVEDFRAGRITAIEYINKVTGVRDRVINQVNETVPECLYNNPLALACYQQIKPIFASFGQQEPTTAKSAAAAALALTNIIRQNWKVRFWDDVDTQNRVMNLIDDYLYDEVNAKTEFALKQEHMDSIIRIVFQQARSQIQQ